MGFFDRFFGPTSKDSFARKMTEAIAAAGVKGPIRYDPKEFALHFGIDFVYNLGNMYAEYCGAKKADRKQTLARFARAAIPIELPVTLDEAMPQIIPRIRDRFFYEVLQLSFRLKGKESFPSATIPLADQYVVELGYDLPDSMLSLTTDHFKKWGTTLDSVIGRAMDNLVFHTKRKLKTVRHGLYESDWKDNYDACRILLKDFILSHEVHGEPVVAIPNRDTLILTGSRDEAGLKALVLRSEEVFKAPRPMFGLPLVLSEGRYLPISPEPGQVAYRELKKFCLACQGTNYHEQKELLEALHEKEGRDIFVASYSSIQRKEEEGERSWCSWAKGVDSLLPKTDLIVLGEPDKKGKDDGAPPVLVAEWEQVMRVAGDLMKPQECFPPRFRVTAFPNDAQLEELRRSPS